MSQRLMAVKAFYTLISGQFVSTIGSGMTRFGLGVWVFTETGDASAYTAMLFFAVFPIGIGSLVAGPLIDRWDRRRVMIAGNVVASLSTLVVALLFFADALALWHLYLALSINGLANAFILPTVNSSVPLLVPRDKLNRAAGLTQLIQSFEAILSPSLAGFIVGFLGLGAIFVIDFVTFGVSIVALLLIAIPQPRRDDAAQALRSFWQDFAFGLRYVWQRPPFLYLMSLFAVTLFLLPGVGYSLVTPTVLSFASEETLGLVISSFGVGSLVGGFLLAMWNNSQRRMTGILISMTTAGVAAILISLRESALLIGAGFFITGVSFVFIVGLNQVIWQMKAPPQILGRIFSLQIALGVVAQSLGILIAGPLTTNLFEPLLMGDGALAGSIGALIGTGAGRGMAFVFLLVGLLQLGIVLASARTRSVRLLEDELPDYDEPEEALVDVDLASQPQAI